MSKLSINATVIDPSTGEIQNGRFVQVNETPGIREDHVKLFTEGIQSIRKAGLTLTQLNVLLYLIEHCNYDNFALVPSTEIAGALNLQAPHVSRALRVLQEKNLIKAGPKIGRTTSWKLNPFNTWKGGRPKKLASARNAHLRLVTT